MSNQEKNTPTKKKVLMYYLILAACALVIAAITVGIVFAVRSKQSQSIDKPNIEQPDDKNPGDNDPDVNKPDDNKPDDGNGDKDPDKNPGGDKPVGGTYAFIVPVSNAQITQEQVFAYDKTLDRYCMHNGIDFSAQAGTEVLAVCDGTVKSVYTDDLLFGAVITIEHADGVTTVYKFITPAESLKAGDKVSSGDVIGTIATATGVENAEGDHLHFEVYKGGELADPEEYLDISNK